MELSVHTKLVLFLGKPLGQSISTAVINLAYRTLQLDYLRIPIEIDAQRLPELVGGMRTMNLAGFNVTKPNKIAILPFLDRLDPLAQQIGAVNCVTCRDGVWTGYNTDAEGFLRSFQGHCCVRGLRIFCIGAGGAGRAICFALASAGAASIAITDLRDAAAVSLVQQINVFFPGVAQALPFQDEGAREQALQAAQAVTNASGIGMAPHVGESPVPPHLLRPEQMIFDAAYNPTKTQLLLDAQALGCRCWNGREMVMHCNRIGFERITGTAVPAAQWAQFMQTAEQAIE